MQDLLESEHFSATENVSLRLSDELKQVMQLSEAVASLSGTIVAMENEDEFTMNLRIKAVVAAYPDIDRVFVTRPDGILWSQFPNIPGAFAQSYSEAEWFFSALESQKPFVSGIYSRPSIDGNESFVSIASRIQDRNGAIIGMLVFEYGSKQIHEWLDKARLTRNGYVFIVDHNGAVVAHPHINHRADVFTEFDDIVAIQRALDGDFHTSRYIDPYENEEVIATLLPITIGKNTWVIVAQQTSKNAYAELNKVKLNISIAGGVLTLFTIMMIVALARTNAKNIRLNRELNTKNQALRETSSIVDSSNDAIMGLTLQGVVRTWNAGAEKLYGYTPYEMIGKPIAQLISDDGKAELAELLSQTRDGKKVEHVDSVHLKKDQSPVNVSLTISPVKDEKGTVVGVSGIARDISEQKKIEQMKSDFISFVSHQLKAPVTAMKWVLEELFDGTYGPLTEEIKEPLKQLQDVNANNHHLIADILNASRIDRGVIAVDLKTLPLKDVADQATRDYYKATEKVGLTLSIQEDEENIMVQVDKEKMAEAVSNSISNAMKHTKSGGITLTLRQKDGYGIIDVTDTGEGMPQEIVDKLFTRDEILGASANAEKSAGLGLYIAKNFMSVQNGDISVSSIEGKGTTFTYRVPLAGNTKIDEST